MEREGKTPFDRLIVPIIIVLVALAAFGLGRLSALMGEQGTLQIEHGEIR